MKKILLLVLLTLTACLPGGPADNTGYRSGTQGLELSFGDTPSKVYEGTDMNLMVEIRNKGAHDLDNGLIYISGHDPSAIQFSDTQLPLPEILGKSAYIEDGGYEILQFPESQSVKVPFGESYEPTLMLSSCYEYRTVATPNVCVISHPSDIMKNDVCRPETITMSGQGAPVAVTKIEQEVMEQMMNFIITVENLGGGKVVNRNVLYEFCPFQLKHHNLNQVQLQVQMSGTEDIVCNPQTIRLVDGKGVSFCKAALEMETSYTTPLIIQLDYGYTDSVTKTFEIVRPPGSAKNDLGDPVDNPSGTQSSNSGSSSTVSTSSTASAYQPTGCRCGPSNGYPDPDDPCVCIYYQGQNVFCDPSNGGYDIVVYETSPSFTVRGSNTGMTSCGVNGDMGSCGSSRTYNLNLARDSSTTIRVSASGPGGSASQSCSVYNAGGI